MSANIKTTKGFQLFNVPNTPEGNAFRKELGKFLNRSRFRLKANGRGTRKHGGQQSFVPIGISEWIAVYANLKEGTILELRDKANAAEQQAAWLQRENERLKLSHSEQDRTIGSLKALTNAQAEELKKLRGNTPVNVPPQTPLLLPQIKQEGKDLVIRISLE